MFGLHQTHHVHWGVILQLGLVVVFLVVLVTLQFGQLHVVDHQRIVLDAAETDMVALCLLKFFLILDLEKKGVCGR